MQERGLNDDGTASVQPMGQSIFDIMLRIASGERASRKASGRTVSRAGKLAPACGQTRPRRCRL